MYFYIKFILYKHVYCLSSIYIFYLITVLDLTIIVAVNG